MTVNSVK